MTLELDAALGTFAPACDHHELPLMNGWHLLIDPEGIEGTQRIPCPLSTPLSTPRKHRHEWEPRWVGLGTDEAHIATGCRRCPAIRDDVKARRGKQSRNYGNRAELSVARTYGGQKIGHAGGPVDVRGADWNTQVKTHRRKPPREWTSAFQAMSANRERMPRLLLRFVMGPGIPPEDYVVVRGSDWLAWHGKDEEA